ncbi:histidine kinase [Spirillospora sp. NPDC029432]|uniref:sensor histidine kinase n=1 Tax=Spirillospora sp. NPDC029432 TaxID=3154599 RepID=UPI003452B63A
MGATTAELEERAAGRLESYRRVMYRTFLFSAAAVAMPCAAALASAYREGEIGLPITIAAALGTVLFLRYNTRLIRTGLKGRLPRRDIAASGALALVLSLMMLTHPLWCVVPVFWVSTVALWVRSWRRQAALCAAAGLVCAAVISFADGPPGHWTVPLLVFGVFTAASAAALYTNVYYRRMWDLHQEADAAREAQARLAVTEERLRFSRDLHDLLGHSLSLIAVKSELAMRMAEDDPARAREEMADVRRAARDALREVRAAVRGYRAVELDAELAGVRAVLEAAGVRCEIGAPPDLAEDTRTVLAWVIREGATNVIKHSEAARCAISIAPYGDSVVLEMSNDGARASGGAPGSGLAGLAERVEVLGGTLTATRQGRDGFLLRAVVPA